MEAKEGKEMPDMKASELPVQLKRPLPKIKKLIDTPALDSMRAEEFIEEIGKRLYLARQKADLSVADLAARTGLSETQIYKYERGGTIGMRAFARVMVALDLSWDVLPLFDDDTISIGKEFECIVKDLNPKLQTQILNELRAIVGLIKRAR